MQDLVLTSNFTEVGLMVDAVVKRRMAQNAISRGQSQMVKVVIINNQVKTILRFSRLRSIDFQKGVDGWLHCQEDAGNPAP